MTKQQKWMVAAIVLLPVVAGMLVLAYDQATGGGMLSGGKVALVHIEDVIIESEPVTRQLKTYAEDPTVKALVLRLNSPGGAVAASQEIYQAVRDFRGTGKPVVVSMGNVAASGAYYIACAADRVYAVKGTLTGSIGVVMTLSRVHKLFDKVGIERESITTGRYKDAGSPYREMTEEERAYLQGVIDDSYEQFVADVCESRGMDPDSLRPLAQGQIYTGRQAYEAGLVDTLGNFHAAVAEARALAGLPEDAGVVQRDASMPNWMELLQGRLPGATEFVREVLYRGGMYYLYEGG